MNRADRIHLTLAIMGLFACILLNVWVFRFGILFGLVGLNLTKHVGVAVLCQAVGVNKGNPTPNRRRRQTFDSAHPLFAGPHSLAKDAR